MSVAARVRIAGPLTRYFEGFAAELAAHGYTDLSAANQLRLMADLSRWLVATRTPVDDLDHDLVIEFLARRRRSYTGFLTVRALTPLLRYLVAVGVSVVEAPEPVPHDELLREFERYLIEERAVLPARQHLCLRVAAEFLGSRRVSALKARDVTRFVDTRAGRPGLSGVLSALRAALRFLFVTAKTSSNLVHAVPTMPRWRLGSLPRFLEPRELEAVYATCDRRTLVGARNYAVLVLLGRLGLRAGEVAALQLEDVDWLRGELVVRGKGRALSRLPLPVDLGEALVAYLRRATRSRLARALFVRCRAPYDAVKPGAVTAIAATALRAAGIRSGGAHRLRHTAATQMLRGGASLTEVAQVLRHQHVDTTAIYAKVDRDALRSIAMPWPANPVDDGRIRELAPAWPGGAA